LTKGGKRIFTRPVGGGGGAPGGPASIVVGPDFGVATSGNVQESVMTAHSEITEYDLTEEQTFTDYAQIVGFSPSIQESQMLTFGLTNTYPMTTHESAITVSEFNVNAKNVVKDVYASTLQAAGVCVDTANHNGENLLVDANDRAYIGFDLSGFSPVVSVQSATLHLTKVSVTTLMAGTMNLVGISSLLENWTEAALICANAPPAAGPAQSVALSTSTGAVAYPLAASAGSWTTYLAGRMGTTNTATIRIEGIAAGSTATIYSKEVSAVDGARLSFTYRT
jgi:hypothetical protein